MELGGAAGGLLVEDGIFGVAGAGAALGVEVGDAERGSLDGAGLVTLPDDLEEPAVVLCIPILQPLGEGAVPPVSEVRFFVESDGEVFGLLLVAFDGGVARLYLDGDGDAIFEPLMAMP